MKATLHGYREKGLRQLAVFDDIREARFAAQAMADASGVEHIVIEGDNPGAGDVERMQATHTHRARKQ